MLTAMKTFLLLISIIVVLFLLLFFVLGKYSQRGQAPGLVSGGLAKCSTKPNCVCSEYNDEVEHYIKPIKNIFGIEEKNISLASDAIREMGGTIHMKTDEYIAATFSSSVFGFVDDFEIRSDQTHGILHIRSASRVGYSDAGVNRKRVALFKKLLAEKIKQPSE